MLSCRIASPREIGKRILILLALCGVFALVLATIVGLGWLIKTAIPPEYNTLVGWWSAFICGVLFAFTILRWIFCKENPS